MPNEECSHDLLDELLNQTPSFLVSGSTYKLFRKVCRFHVKSTRCIFVLTSYFCEFDSQKRWYSQETQFCLVSHQVQRQFLSGYIGLRGRRFLPARSVLSFQSCADSLHWTNLFQSIIMMSLWVSFAADWKTKIFI
jgi:hypothetical protein